MKDQQFYDNQDWIAQEAAGLSNYKRLIRTSSSKVGFDGSLAAPNYFIYVDQPPSLEQTVPIPAKSRETPLVGLTVSAYISNDDSVDVNTVGFLSMGIGLFANKLTPLPFVGVAGASIPTLLNAPGTYAGGGWTDLEAAESYDPTALPIGGADYPIWTQQVADPLSVIAPMTANFNQQDIPGYIRAVAIVQVNGNTTTVDAATIQMRWTWQPVSG